MRILVGAGRAPARGLAMGFRQSLEEADKSERHGRIRDECAGFMHHSRTPGRAWSSGTWRQIAPKVEQRHDRSGPPRHEVELLLARIDEECRRRARPPQDPSRHPRRRDDPAAA